MMDVKTLGVGQMRARVRWPRPGLAWPGPARPGPASPVWARQLCARGSLGLLLCMSGPVINDPQTLLFTPSPPREAGAATAHLANGHPHEHGRPCARDEGLYTIKCTRSESNFPLTKEHFSRLCIISGQRLV